MGIKQISRRAFLQAGSATLALPFFEAMLPFRSTAMAQTATPLRYACLYFPHGTTESAEWEPTIVNGQLRLNASMMHASLEAYKTDISFIKNIMVETSAYHPGQVTAFMAGGFNAQQAIVQTRKTIDQIIADQFQGGGCLRDLVLGSDDQSGGESGVSGVYGTNISWSGENAPCTRRIRNSQIFDLIFPGGGATTTPTPTPAPSQAKARQSILDFAKDSVARLQAQLGTYDKQTLEQYLTSVREVEKKIQMNPDPVMTPPPTAPSGPPTLTNPAMATCQTLASLGNCADYATDMDIKMDLIALAFMTDRTRVATHIFDPEPGYRSMSFISGVRGAAHDISHWRESLATRKPMVQKITAFYTSKFARLLSRLKSMREGNGTVLDNSLIMFGSTAMDSNNHEKTNSPIIIAGRAGGALTQGQLRVLAQRTNISHLHLAIAKKMGVNITSYAGSSSPVTL